MKIGSATLAAFALLTTAAAAQSYGPVEPPSGTNEVVTVTAPRPHERQRSEIGAPIVKVSLSREVRFDDLDLRTARGAHALRNRVRDTARALCHQIDQQYLVTDDDTHSCIRTATQDALAQVNGSY
ncbi:MAG TPA: UrcA family protein [Rhizomicrobium sp.]|nr:UrcA family protein [Rhizomicrobium sp.]